MHAQLLRRDSRQASMSAPVLSDGHSEILGTLFGHRISYGGEQQLKLIKLRTTDGPGLTERQDANFVHQAEHVSPHYKLPWIKSEENPHGISVNFNKESVNFSLVNVFSSRAPVVLLGTHTKMFTEQLKSDFCTKVTGLLFGPFVWSQLGLRPQ